MMILRAAKAKLLDLLQRFPAVAMLGPRQAGKTTLALSLGRAA
jgi:predicted AAA+ superfamily ATPase